MMSGWINNGWLNNINIFGNSSSSSDSDSDSDRSKTADSKKMKTAESYEKLLKEYTELEKSVDYLNNLNDSNNGQLAPSEKIIAKIQTTDKQFEQVKKQLFGFILEVNESRDKLLTDIEDKNRELGELNDSDSPTQNIINDLQHLNNELRKTDEVLNKLNVIQDKEILNALRNLPSNMQQYDQQIKNTILDDDTDQSPINTMAQTVSTSAVSQNQQATEIITEETTPSESVSEEELNFIQNVNTENTEAPVISNIIQNSSIYEKLAKNFLVCFNICKNKNVNENPSDKVLFNSTLEKITSIVDNLTYNTDTYNAQQDIALKEAMELSSNNDEDNVNNYLYKYYLQQNPREDNHLYSINRITLVAKYLSEVLICYYHVVIEHKNRIGYNKIFWVNSKRIKNIYSPLINEIYEDIQDNKFQTYLSALELNGIKPEFYSINICQNPNTSNNSNSQQNDVDIECTVTLTPLSMILWILPEIYNYFKSTTNFTEIIENFIKKTIDKTFDKTFEYNKILLEILNSKSKSTLNEEISTELMLMLFNHYRIPFLNSSENKNKVMYNLISSIKPKNKWASSLPGFLNNKDTNIFNTSDINDKSKLQFTNLDNLHISNIKKITQFDAGNPPTHGERANPIQNNLNIINYTFNLEYKPYNSRPAIKILQFKSSSTENKIFLYSIKNNKNEIKKPNPENFYIRTILNDTNINNTINNIKRTYAHMEKFAEEYKIALSTVKLCGDMQYFISSLVSAANVDNIANKNNIFMDSSEDYSCIFHVLGLQNCVYKKNCTHINGNINDNNVNLQEKNIIGNLASIRKRGINFVPKSDRMINIITFLFAILQLTNDMRIIQLAAQPATQAAQPATQATQAARALSNLRRSTRIQKSQSNSVILNSSSSSSTGTPLMNEDNYNLMVNNYKRIKRLLDFYKNYVNTNVISDTNVLNLDIDQRIYNIFKTFFVSNNNTDNLNQIKDININTLFLDKIKEITYDFTYDDIDYWIAENIYDEIISRSGSSSGSGNGSNGVAMDITNGNPGGGSKKNKTIKHKRNRKNKTNRNKRNRRNRRNKTIRKKRKRKNKTIKYI